jgi:hypothetical protein
MIARMRNPLHQIFTNLDRWRHLPGYQLERRFDIFLSPYLRQIVEAKVGVVLDQTIVPEMPLKQLTTNLSDKVDYVLFSANRSAGFLIELKTDCGSVRTKQDDYLEHVAARPWREVLEDLKLVAQASGSRRKYIHLLALLQRAGQVKLSAELMRCFDNGQPARFKPQWVEVTTKVDFVTPIFITPTAMAGRNCITFADIRGLLPAQDDPLAEVLVEYLRRWECEAAWVSPDAACT